MTDHTQHSNAKPTTGEGKKSKWTEFGAAWPHRDGDGFAITCTAIPLQGRIVMRAITEGDAPDGGR